MTVGNRGKILFVITKSNWGGAQRYVFDLATTINKDKLDVVVAHGGEGALHTKLKNAGIRTIHIAHLERNLSLSNEILAFFELRKIISQERT